MLNVYEVVVWVVEDQSIQGTYDVLARDVRDAYNRTLRHLLSEGEQRTCEVLSVRKTAQKFVQ